ncbi:MAG TPA: hypothetical protein VHG69_09825 [Thermoleophilaceae bacterium]|nr:hypothetical protein [Thermoleophilaceae bacterium]
MGIVAASIVRGATIAWVLAALAICAAAAVAEPYGPVAGNPADRLAHLAIDDYGSDDARRCRRNPMSGTVSLERWLTRNVRGVSWGIVRCSRLDRRRFSLHAEGRAVDWHLDARSRTDRRAARRLIMMLLASDRAGNPHALARRMGIQEIIWDCRSWWSGSDRMEPYAPCLDRRGRVKKNVNVTLARRDHVHIGLNLAGARKRSTFWRR